MVTTGPSKTEITTAYLELEESRSALLIPEEVTSAQAQEERKARFFDRVGHAFWRLSMVLAPYGACFTPGLGMNFRQSKVLSPREKTEFECRLIPGL